MCRKVINWRKEDGNFLHGDVAIYQCHDEQGTLRDLIVQSDSYDRGSDNLGHAERRGWRILERRGSTPSQVKSLYTKLEPCTTPTISSGFAMFLQRTFPHLTDITFSFEYGDYPAPPELAQASRNIERAVWEKAVDALKP